MGNTGLLSAAVFVEEKSHAMAADYRRSATMAQADFRNVDFSRFAWAVGLNMGDSSNTHTHTHMGVSTNGGSPIWMVCKGKSHLEMGDD